MHRIRSSSLALLAALLVPIAGAVARSGCPVDLSCTDDAGLAHEQALTLAGRFGTAEVLVVVDIDETLLRMDQYLGSDDWFNWQAGLLRENPRSPDLTASSFDGLLTAQAMLHTLSRMHPAQPDLPTLVEDLQNRGIRLIALTSRGFDVRDATRRELLRNGYDLSRNPIPPRPGFAGDDPFLPYHPGNLESIGLTPVEAARFGLGTPRPVSYRNGVYMTAGQHKGAMLRALLARTGHRFRAVVFLDDQARNVRAMGEAYHRDRGSELHAYVYTRDATRESDTRSAQAKRLARAAWNRLAATLAETFPSRRGLPGSHGSASGPGGGF